MFVPASSVQSERGPRSMAGVLALFLVASALVVLPRATPAAAAVPSGFSEAVAFAGLVNPTAVRFSPDGRVFVAEKRGTIQMFDSLTDTTPTQITDLRTEVHNYWDRGLLGLALDPDFPTKPYLYAMYTFDGAIGATAPRWGTPGADSDGCPTPPGATDDGCVVSGKVVKLTLSGTTTTKQDLINDWCQQYPSHSVGDLVFGANRALYVSAGDGASFNFADYGQDGSPLNPCGDPPGGVGAVQTPPTAEGGALRSQDLRTTADPVGLDGTVIRVSPDTGLALPDNPNAGASSENARRIVAYGMRNPFRMTMRPGTEDLWIGDVGWDTWEELNHIASPTASVTNFGWPCYEGDARQPSYDAADLSICENLYAQGTADTKPYFSYRHGQPVNVSDNCTSNAGSSVTGMSFQFYSGGPYPAEYDGALFFADYARDCIYVMTKGTDGLPDRLKLKPFVSSATNPVDVELSPGGEIYYADLDGGTIRRIVYSGSTVPLACPAGQYLAQYYANMTLSGAPANQACEPGPLVRDYSSAGPPGVGVDNFSARWTGTMDFPTTGTYAFTVATDDGVRVWIDGAVLFDEWRDQGATFTASRSLTAGAHQVKVEYYENAVLAFMKLTWTAPAEGSPPTAQISSPPTGTTFRVGDTISFAGSATDPEDGALPASALSWELIEQHCPSACHSHSVQTWTGVASGSFVAPDHEYPSYLDLVLTAVDSAGNRTTVTRRLDPQTVAITLASQPAGLQLTLGSRTATAPFTTTVIVGSKNSMSAASPQTLSGSTYAFAGWSDGGAQSHDVIAGSTATTYTAAYAVTTGCPAGQYRAEYFANRTVTGAPASSGCEAAPLNQNWGTRGPAGVGQNNFSARWTGSFTFTGGAVTLSGASDDGMRVWIDGVLVVDRWNATGAWTLGRTVTVGTHVVRVEYFERTGNASVRLAW